MDAATPRGRYREAAQNDVRIFEAAREVFTRDPDAPIAAVGTAAGVGKSALYRRYASKEDLLRAVGQHLTERYVALTDLAHQRLDDGVDSQSVLESFLADAADTGTHALMPAISGKFEPTARDRELSAEGWRSGDRLVARLHAAGVIVAEIGWLDLNKLLEGFGGVHSPDPARTPLLRRRFAAVLAAGLAAAAGPLPGVAVEALDFAPTPRG